jgi:hypothetical protein
MYKQSLFLILYCFVLNAAAAQGSAGGNNPKVLTGGVGIESGEALRPRLREFNLKCVFTLVEGDYIADVAVKIADSRGRVVVEQLSDGPLLLTRLPAGRYLATLTFEGVTQTRPFSLAAKGQRTLQVRFKRSAADGPPLL